MTRSQILRSVTTVLCTLATLQMAFAGERPNVVLIMTDNHGAWTLGCYGNSEIRTPNIDRLAAEGTLFTRAFASNPVCSPTRATFLTGLVPSQHGVHSFLSGGRLQVGPGARCTLDEFTSLPEVLRDAGYACGLVGKWHLGDNLRPQEGLDDYWITMPHGGTSTFYDAQVIENGEIRKEPKYLTDLWTEHALKFVDQQADQDQPFLLFLAYNGPYSLGRLLLRDGRNRHADYYADKPLLSFPRTQPHPWQLNNLDYINNPTSIRRVATEVSGVDDGVGDVMNALRKHGLDENTVVVFVADQGWVGGHGGFFGMGDHTRPLTARDGMMRIPMIWRHPDRIAAGRRQDQMIANYDLLPTLLGHLGMTDKMPAFPKSPGRDFSTLLTGKVSSEAYVDGDAVFYEFENLRCIRTTTAKYIHRHPNGPHELYDLVGDPDEFVNLVDSPEHSELQRELKSRLDQFYAKHSLPKYDMWKGGTSQVRIHDGIDQLIAARPKVDPPPLPDDYRPAPVSVPDGFTVELAAGPPLVTHPTMACFDDKGRLYVCNNAGVNMTNDELEEHLPNSIRRLVDSDRDGRFDSFTVFADKMTFPMGGVWHDGSLYVASPPNIWRLTDTDDDGVADQREIIVDRFGYNGNAASVHGCFLGPDGRLYWTDGYHGHEFTDQQGNVTSRREGSYLFSSQLDGSDARIHCGGGMDNPVEIDFTDSGDMLGTVNILYTRPRVDCLVHWLYGGAYPHRERVLSEIQVTGDLLGPAHRFGHVAVSGLTRYRSGVIDHRWGDDFFATFFNSGKVVRLSLDEVGSTYRATQHEFLSSTSREFHPTDVLEDADGSLLVVDTGGWFYRGCPTSQFSKPELLGGIYRVRRRGMTTMVDPRGEQIDWNELSPAALVKLLNDTRFAVRERAIGQCASRGRDVIPTLASQLVRGDIRVRQNSVWALSRMISREELAEQASGALRPALGDRVANVRQAACYALSLSVATVDPAWILPLLEDDDASVRRQAAATLGRIGDAAVLPALLAALDRSSSASGIDRSEQHAIVYAMIEIGSAEELIGLLEKTRASLEARLGAMTAIDQIDSSKMDFREVINTMSTGVEDARRFGIRVLKKHPEWAPRIAPLLRRWVGGSQIPGRGEAIDSVIEIFLGNEDVAQLIGQWLAGEDQRLRLRALRVISRAGRIEPHPNWISPLLVQLESDDPQVVSRALGAVASLSGDDFRPQLNSMAASDSLPLGRRMEALSAIVAQSGKLAQPTLEQLIAVYRDSGSPAAADQSAQMIGGATLTSDQQMQVIPLIQDASPSQLRELLRCYQRGVTLPVARAFLAAIEDSDSRRALAEQELSEVVKRFPQETLDQANALLDQLKANEQHKLLRIQNLRDQVADGNTASGQAIFASEKAKCSSCHRVGKAGKAVGPDLTTIGSNRSAADLIESIVFPSASIVRDYQTYQVLTTDGRALTGLVSAESVDTIELQLANGEKLSIDRENIEQIKTSAVSIMPAGLDEALSESELLDVVKYLQSLSP